MKIIEFSFLDNGGAGIAAVRYHKLLQIMGHECTLYVSSKEQDDSSIIEITDSAIAKNQNSISSKVINYLERIKKKLSSSKDPIISALEIYCYYNFEELRKEPNLNLLSKINMDSVDAIFIYWLGNFLNTTDIKYLYEKTGARIIFAMMDMEPITGGCHYFWNCTNFKTNCFNCPALPYEKQEFSHMQLQKRALNTAYINAEIFSSSFYDLQSAHDSIVNFYKYWHLYYPINETIFYPKEKTDNDKLYLFSIANKYHNSRKGFWLLIQILIFIDQTIADRKIVFLCLDKSVFSDYKFVNIEFEEFEFCTNPNDLAAIYRKADIFLCTSVQDAAPMMLAEALMCGLPTISFDTATAKQFIEDNIDGYVIDQYDTVGFAKKVIDLIDQIGSGKFTFQNKRRLHEKMINLYGIDAVKKQMGVILNTPNDN